IDLRRWVAGESFGLQALSGQLGGTAKPFDPGRRVIVRPERGGPGKVFIGTPPEGALFKGLVLQNAAFPDVRPAGATLDDIDFSNAVITSNCNFNGMRIAGVSVKELLAAYEQRHSHEQSA